MTPGVRPAIEVASPWGGDGGDRCDVVLEFPLGPRPLPGPLGVPFPLLPQSLSGPWLLQQSLFGWWLLQQSLFGWWLLQQSLFGWWLLQQSLSCQPPLGPHPGPRPVTALTSSGTKLAALTVPTPD